MQRSAFRSRAVVWVSCLLLAVAACSSNEQKVQEHLAKSEEYSKAGQDKEGLIELRNALKLDPKSAETNYRIGHVLMWSGEMSDALFYLREAQRLDPKRSDAALDEAKLLLGTDLDRANVIVQEVLQREPANPMAQMRRMEVALHAGNTQDALSAAMTALELAPNDPLYHLQLGTVNLARIRETRAQGQPAPDALFEAALASFKKSDELYSGNVNARVQAARTYLSWGGHEKEAAEAFKSAVQAAKTSTSELDRGVATAAALDFVRFTKDPALAKEALEEVVSIDAGNLVAWGRLADLEQLTNGNGKAVYEKVLAQRPDDLDAHWQFAVWLYANDRGPEGLEHLTALAASSKDRARALALLHALQVQLQKAPEARATLATMEKEFPGNPSTQLALARQAAIESRFADAAPILRTLAGSSQSPEVLQLLALSEFHLGNLPAALVAINNYMALGKGPTAESMLLKARIHYASRDYPVAIQSYTQVLQAGFDVPLRDQVFVASAMYQAGQPQAGRQLLEQILAQQDPPIIASIEFMAREGVKSPEAARKHIEAALQRAPNHPGLLNAITRIDLEAGRNKEALARLDAVIESGQAPPAALLARARILAGQKKFEAAESDVNRVVEAAPNAPGALDLLIQIYGAQDKLGKALASFEEADRAGALSGGSRVLMARLYLAEGDRVKARAAFEKALSERADLPSAKNDLAFLLAADGVELDRALSLAQEAQQAMAEDPNVADTLGFIYFKKGLFEPAAQQAKYAVQLAEQVNQQQPVIHYHLGLALRALGQNAEAAEAFERALALDQNFPEAASARSELEAAKASASSTPSSS